MFGHLSGQRPSTTGMDDPNNPPHEALLTGYYMNLQDFENLTVAINPQWGYGRSGKQGYDLHLYYYHAWRSRLPWDVRAKAPDLKTFHDYEHMANSGQKNIDANHSKFFFLLHVTPLPEGSLMDDFPPSITHEDEGYEEQRDVFIQIVWERHGYAVDRRSLRFGCFRDVNPVCDPHRITWS